jgi:hypothetical protein
MSGNFDITYKQALPKVFLPAGPSATKHGPNTLDEVITGHVYFCALLASRGTAAAFLKAGCTHAKIVNKPTFSFSSSDLVDIPGEARSIGNRFITQIWAKGGRELAGDEARKLLNSVCNFYLSFTLVFLYYICDDLKLLSVCRMVAPKDAELKLVPKG